MYYDFKCKECDHEQGATFPANDYDDYVMEDGRLKRKKCEECKTISLYRHIIDAPAALGGTKGYKSMERYQADNPGNSRRLQDQLETKMADRHRKRVLDNINKQMGGGKRGDRHKDYGDGQGEKKLRSDD
jgi:hypothetical protein